MGSNEFPEPLVGLQSIGPHSYESGRESPTDSTASSEDSTFSLATSSSTTSFLQGSHNTRPTKARPKKLKLTVPPTNLSAGEKEFIPRPLPPKPFLKKGLDRRLPSPPRSRSPSKSTTHTPRTRRTPDVQLQDIPESPPPVQQPGLGGTTVSDRPTPRLNGTLSPSGWRSTPVAGFSNLSRRPPPSPPPPVRDNFPVPTNHVTPRSDVPLLPLGGPAVSVPGSSTTRRCPPPPPEEDSQRRAEVSTTYVNDTPPPRTGFIRYKVVLMTCVVCFFISLSTLGLHFYMFFSSPGVDNEPMIVKPPEEKLYNKSLEKCGHARDLCNGDVKQIFQNITKAAYCHVKLSNDCHNRSSICISQDKNLCLPTVSVAAHYLSITVPGVYYVYASVSFFSGADRSWNVTVNYKQILRGGYSRSSDKVSHFTGGVFPLKAGYKLAVKVADVSQVMGAISSFGIFRLRDINSDAKKSR